MIPLADNRLVMTLLEGQPQLFWDFWTPLSREQRRALIEDAQDHNVGLLGFWWYYCTYDEPGDFGASISPQRWRERLEVGQALLEEGVAVVGMGDDDTFDRHPLLALVLPEAEFGRDMSLDTLDATVAMINNLMARGARFDPLRTLTCLDPGSGQHTRGESGLGRLLAGDPLLLKTLLLDLRIGDHWVHDDGFNTSVRGFFQYLRSEKQDGSHLDGSPHARTIARTLGFFHHHQEPFLVWTAQLGLCGTTPEDAWAVMSLVPGHFSGVEHHLVDWAMSCGWTWGMEDDQGRTVVDGWWQGWQQMRTGGSLVLRCAQDAPEVLLAPLVAPRQQDQDTSTRTRRRLDAIVHFWETIRNDWNFLPDKSIRTLHDQGRYEQEQQTNQLAKVSFFEQINACVQHATLRWEAESGVRNGLGPAHPRKM